MTLEEIAALFLRAQPARGETWYVQPLWRDQVYATRAANGAYGLFVRGTAEDFGRLPPSMSLSFATDVVMEPLGTTSPMLRVVAPDKAQANRALLFVAYEARRLLDDDPSLTKEELLRRLIWILILLEDDTVVLTPERQRGLVGELQLLARLVRRARALRRPAQIAVERWLGAWPSKRDFSSNGIAVEVKTSSEEARIHTIASLSQLDPQDSSEEVFLYSLGVRHDYSAPRRLKHFVEDVDVLLEDAEKDEFHSRLAEYGFDSTRTDLYDAEPGFAPIHLSPLFFPEAGLLRLRKNSFVGGEPPASVLAISYRLLVIGEPCPSTVEEGILDRLLG